MTAKKKLPFWLQLTLDGARSYVLWSARVLILSWYVYGVIELSRERGQGGGYLYLAMVLLSVFGLFQIIELIAAVLKLKEPTPQKKRSVSQTDA